MADTRPRQQTIMSFLERVDTECVRCAGDGLVCENHRDEPWRPDAGARCCGGAGMPCECTREG